ncbi:MAG TPA: N-6 DNA methylase [Bryobacteraceae bacterium]|nr:N-6 DNA methylase [Bryobacteraceae bacterium]
MPQKPHPKKEAEHQSALWALVDRLRGGRQRLSLDMLVQTAREQKIPVTWQDLRSFTVRHGGANAVVIPPYVTDFICDYIIDEKPQSVLDPWAGIGSLLLPIVEKNAIRKAQGISPVPPEVEMARSMDERSVVEWTPSAPSEVLDELGTFDLIVSSPPWNLGTVAEKFGTGGGIVEVKDSKTHVLALKSATHLSEHGEAIFVLPNSFFFSAQSAAVRDALPKLGLFIHTILTLPANIFAPFTVIESNLVFLSRKRVAEIFVGRLNSEQDPTPLLGNLKKRKPGAAPELGRLVALEGYRGWHALVAAEEEQRLAERSGLTPVPVADIVDAVNLANRGKAEVEAFADLPNSVYLPLIGTSPAVSALSDLRIKPHNYAQLVVSPDKAYAGFLAEFFNSPLGRKTRDGLLSVGFIPKISKQTLLGGTVYLLPLEAQRTAVDVTRQVEELRLQLEQLKAQLWGRPVDAARVRKVLGKLNQKEGFDAWLETLPFPLASILQRYAASINPERKVGHLLNFFEATAQFLGTLMTSAMHDDQNYFQQHKGDWFEAGKDNPHSLAKSSFGEWVVRCQRLAKTTRQMLSSEDKDEQNRCLGFYRASDRHKIAAIADKNLYAILEKTSRYRNNWKGHGGIVAEKEQDHRLTLLQEELTRLRGILGGAFEDWWLIRSRPKAYTAGMHYYEAEKLMGSHQIFKQVEIATSVLMDSTELYFFDTTTRQPLQTLHFFRMMSVPESEQIACYFFTRLDKKNVCWISYHFEGDKADRTEPDTSVLRLIEEVEQNGGG